MSFFRPLVPRARARGLTLIEMAVVMGVMGLVMGALWTVVGVVWDNYKGLRTRQEVIAVVQNVRTYYLNRKKIDCETGVDITSVLDDNDRRLIPTEMRANPDVEGGKINHALASTDTGTFAVTCLSSGAAFRIKLTSLPRAACASLLMQFPVLMPELGVTNIVRPGGSVLAVNLLDMNEPATGFPMTLTTAVNWCDNDSNEVGFDFKLRN